MFKRTLPVMTELSEIDEITYAGKKFLVSFANDIQWSLAGQGSYKYVMTSNTAIAPRTK